MSVVLSEHLPLLAGAPDGIQKLRGLILELAVRGKLVPQDPNDEPASELLRRIAKERARLVAEGTCKKSKETPVEETESPVSVVAVGWHCAPLGEVVDIVRGITFPSSEKSKTPEDGRLRCLRTANVQDKIEWGDILYIRSEFVSRDDQMLRPNDIVMSMANSRELVGKVALVNSQLEEPATFGGFLGVLRPHLILPRFVMAFLRAPTVRSSLIDSASQTTNIANISLAKLRPLSFPIPPLAEQHRIVAKVDELMALCDRLETEQTDATSAHAKLVETLLGTLTQSRDADELAANWQRLSQHFNTLFSTETSLDALKQTILQLAVMGKLVPQDANDEPASELLKRIARKKAKLTNEDGLRTTAAESISAEDRYMEIPTGWEFQRLGNLAKFIDYRGRTPDKIETGVPLITAKNVRVGFISREPREFISEKEYTEWMTRGFPRVGDILFTTEAPLGNVAVVDIDEKFALAQRVICFQFHEPKIAFYMKLALLSEQVRIQIGDEATGMTATGIKASRLKEIPIPIPPIAEQHRIVAKVDELMALCDRLKADLAEARTRQARLSATLIDTALKAA